MKILFFTDHFKPEPSAPAAHVYERAKIWVDQGHQVTVVCAAPNFPEGKVYPGYRNHLRKWESLDGINVLRIGTLIAANEGFLIRTLDYLSYAISAFCNTILGEKPDVVISTSPHLFVPVAGVAFSLIRRVSHVFEIRDLWPASIVSTGALEAGRVFRALESIELFLYRKSKRILCLSPAFEKDLIGRGTTPDKIDVAINGTNLDLFHPREFDHQLAKDYGLKDRFVVGFLGTVGLAHGLDNVLHTAELLRDSDIVFFIVGVGAAKKALQARVNEKRLENVAFAPRQIREDMPRFWSVCDVSLIHLKDDPVFSTVVPSKIFESMAMGKPILYCCPPGEGSEIVERHGAGLVVSSMQPQALKTAIKRLRDDSALRQQLASGSLGAAPNYSRTAQARKTLQCLARAAGVES